MKNIKIIKGEYLYPREQGGFGWARRWLLPQCLRVQLYAKMKKKKHRAELERWFK